MDNDFYKLFKRIIKPDVIEEALLKDSGDSEFEYPFKDEDVINE